MRTLKYRLWLECLLSIGLTAAAATVAHAADDDQQCAIKDRSAHVVILVCAPTLTTAQWQQQGRNACTAGDQCNVWIWNDGNRAPPRAPRTDAEIPQRHATAAVAIWVNDSQSLITLKPVAAPATIQRSVREKRQF